MKPLTVFGENTVEITLNPRTDWSILKSLEFRICYPHEYLVPV